ncbi:helix-turn-helix domain-containing protein [Jannaschia sp. 2305UL9-9]|uniref:helix-turn-helix domain-containing protein n=1 Tax=Jannaschia sp. 2305UL9-9 TaxID=3121638 RepID=UPI0035278C50
MTTIETAQGAKTKAKKFSSETIFGKEVMGHGFTALPNILVRGQARLGLSTTQFNLLVQLLSYWIDPDRPPFPSKKELAKRVGLNPTTVRINMAKLEERGLIRREQQVTAAGDYGSNIYHMDGLIDALKALEPDFAEERAERAARRAETERRQKKDEAAERARQRGLVRRR